MTYTYTPLVQSKCLPPKKTHHTDMRIFSVRNTADEHNDTLGPHKKSFDNALDAISENLKQASEPVKQIAETLNTLAEAYQHIMDNDPFKIS